MHDWALCVGIGAYSSEAGLDPLPGSLNDAKVIHEWLVDPLGGAVHGDRAKLLLSPSDEQDQNGLGATPLSHEIERFLKNIYGDAEDLRRAGEPRFRRLWLYFSGHGIGFPDDEDVGILTADASPRRRNYSNIAGKAWAEIFQISKAFEEIVLFMDCCRHEINRTTPGGPRGLQEYRANPKGKMLSAFAASPSRSAYEVKLEDGTPRGKFTIELEELLKNPPSTPMSAREFMDQLELRAPFIDPFPPRGHVNDFELLSNREEAAEPEQASMLIAHGESTEELARELAEAMRTPSRIANIMWAPNVLSETSDSFADIKELIVTRDMNSQEVRELIDRVNPERTIIYSKENPRQVDLKGVKHILRHDDSTQGLQKKAAQLQAALFESTGYLSVNSKDTLAKIRVWNADGRTVATGFGELDKLEVPPGKYLVRASLAPHYVEKEIKVLHEQSTTAELPALELGLPSPETLIEWQSVQPTDQNNRSVYEFKVSDTSLFLSAPDIDGWRLEAFLVEPKHAGNVLLRLVPDSHPVGGAPHATDRFRECLRLALAERSWDATEISMEMVAGDPICTLLAASLRLKCGQPYEEFLQVASEYFGEDDPDVKLLHGTANLQAPPLVEYLWHFRNNRDELDVVGDSLADSIVGQQHQAQPWFCWTAESKALKRGWLIDAANVLWPGWSAEPKLEFAQDAISNAQANLGAPAASIKRAAYKSPPVDRLVQHEKIAFVGTSNDQLPAALAVAFVERNKRKWKRLDIWSLKDDVLVQVGSDGRSPEELLAARNLAEGRILELLKVVADEWSLNRYEKFNVEYSTDEGSLPVWCFASLWDWQERGGFVHVSPYKPGQNVRTTDFDDLVWVDEDPPGLYKAAQDAYGNLQIVEVIGRSD